jgi:hypothetical protein
MKLLPTLLLGLISLTALAAAISKDETEVWAFHFSVERKSGSQVVLSQTSTIGIREPGRDWKSRLRQTAVKASAEVREAVEDFIVQNETDSSLAGLVLPGVHLTLARDEELRAVFSVKDDDGWEVFRRKFKSATLHGVSRVGFSKDRRTAVLFADVGRGWTDGEGRIRLLRKDKNGWKEDSSLTLGWGYNA